MTSQAERSSVAYRERRAIKMDGHNGIALMERRAKTAGGVRYPSWWLQ
jgi:hypothetical protein